MRILLVDDHTLMREGLRAVLEKRPDMTVVGEAANGREAMELAGTTRPDVVVMDISMPELNGIDATRRILAEHPHIKVVGLSMNSDRRYVVAMFAAGAHGYLLKDAASDELILAVTAVMRGNRYVSPAVASMVVDALLKGEGIPAPSQEKPLSSREREVLQLLAEGNSSKDIAVRLSLAVPTVETHRRQIMEKLNLHTVAELTKYAIREGLTTV
jgi:DNA-binding NarL/FixJ family response regulator